MTEVWVQWFVKSQHFPFHLEPDREPDVRPETEHRDTTSDAVIAPDPSRLETITPFAWDITPPYETNENVYNTPTNNFDSRFCVLL